MDRVAAESGRGTLLAIKATSRLVIVHLHDCPLLEVEWRGRHYVDGVLPFGLRSASKLFTAIADALELVIQQRGVTHVDHYLIMMGPPGCAARILGSFRLHGLAKVFDVPGYRDGHSGKGVVSTGGQALETAGCAAAVDPAEGRPVDSSNWKHHSCFL